MAKQQLREASLMDLMRAHKHSPMQTPEHSDAQEVEILNTPTPRRPKSKNSGYVKLTAYVPRELHEELKIRLIRERQEISEFVEKFIAEYLKSGAGKGSDVSDVSGHSGV